MAASIGFDFERSVTAPSRDVRHAIGQALGELGFKVTADQLTRIEAQRGSRLAGAMLLQKSAPVAAVLELHAEGDRCTVVAHLVDRLVNLGKSWGVNQPYRLLFDEVQQHLDRALARIDPAAAAAFTPGRFWSKAGDVAFLEQANMLSGRATIAAVGKANQVLEGGTTERGPSAWKGVEFGQLRVGEGDGRPLAGRGAGAPGHRRDDRQPAGRACPQPGR